MKVTPTGRVEPAESVGAVERRIGPGEILDLLLGPVVAASQRDIHPRCRRQRIGEIDPPVLIRGARLRLHDEAADGNARAVRREVGLLIALGEISPPSVEARADRELVRQRAEVAEVTVLSPEAPALRVHVDRHVLPFGVARLDG